MGEWEIEDQLAPLVAQETKETQEKMGNLVLMALLAQQGRQDREALWACLGSVESGVCLACQAQRVHQGKLDQLVQQEIKVHLGLWDPQVQMVL